jgi:hypothetical protein
LTKGSAMYHWSFYVTRKPFKKKSTKGVGGVGKIVVPRPSASASLTGRRQKALTISDKRIAYIENVTKNAVLIRCSSKWIEYTLNLHYTKVRFNDVGNKTRNSKCSSPYKLSRFYELMHNISLIQK